ncbi:MAG: hypothetical protein R3B57_07155 [Phycisphaerales bacterium]
MGLDNTLVIGLDAPAESERVAQAARWIAGLVRDEGRRVIIIAGASPMVRQAGVARANRMAPTADPYEVALALVEPELEAAAVVARALLEAGVRAESLAPESYAPLSRGGPLDAEPRLVDARAYADVLSECEVVVLPGGVGRNFDGRVTSLGDEGACLSALFIADKLALPVVVLDPRGDGWSVPRRAALFARRHGISFDVVGACGEAVARFDPLAPDAPTGPRLRVALLGLGRVGLGVYERLAGAPSRYQVVGVALSSGDARYAAELPRELVSFDAYEILSRRADVLIDLTEPDDPLSELGDEARRRGVNVVRGTGAWSTTPKVSTKWRGGTSAVTA